MTTKQTLSSLRRRYMGAAILDDGYRAYHLIDAIDDALTTLGQRIKPTTAESANRASRKAGRLALAPEFMPRSLTTDIIDLQVAVTDTRTALMLADYDLPR